MSNYEFTRAERDRRARLGLPNPSLEDRILAYEKDLDTKEYVTLQNIETGEVMAVPVTKRGNTSYAQRKRAQLLPVVGAFEDLVLDRQKCVKSRGIHRECYALFITMTHDHNKVTMDESWECFTEECNRFKANIRKTIGSYVSYVVKEGTMSGYSAPHMIMILERPILAKKIRGTWRADRTEDGKDLYRVFHDAWLKASGSPNIDVRAVVDGKVSVRDPATGRTFETSPMRYLLKYVLKAADVEGVRTPEGEKLAKITHAQMKYFGLRDIMGNAFLTVLGLGKTEEVSDLRRLYNELKLLKSRKCELERRKAEIQGAFGYLFSPEYMELCELPEKIEQIQAKIDEVVPPSVWNYTGAHVFPPSRYEQMRSWLESIDSDNQIRREGKRHSMDLNRPDYITAMAEPTFSDPVTDDL